MSKYHSFYDTVDGIVTYGIRQGILQLHTGNQSFSGTCISIGNKPVINFGSCSYLGLEFDPSVKAAAQTAIESYGTQFSASKAYVSLGLYEQLKQLLQQIFNAPVVITPTTTLGHIACIPVVVEEEHAIIMDHQVHNSVQTAVQIVKARGVHTELLRHNRMDLLEERIKELRHKYNHIWYMADGIYSMFGDCCPVDELVRLMNCYPELHCYIDDAHGMCVHGNKGQGYVLSQRPVHTKMIVASSLNKAFASGGGLLIFGNEELARKVGTVGSPLLSSGPMQPGSLGAAVAVAKICLSGQITAFQKQLHENIQLTEQLLKQYQLPLVSQPGGAIFFIAASLPKLAQLIIKKMLDAGYYLNLGVFPTVPMKQAGVRFTVTSIHTRAQIENMVRALANAYSDARQEEMIELETIYKAFKMPLPFLQQENGPAKNNPLQVLHQKSIAAIDKNEWDSIFGNSGNFDHAGMALLEKVFFNPVVQTDNWLFDYLIVKDSQLGIVAATFATTAIWKDDMLSPKTVSANIEKERIVNPQYLTSRTVCCGSLISEGEHFFINQKHPQWKQAIQLVIEKLYQLQETHQAAQIVIRDFYNTPAVLDAFFMDNGFVKINMPAAYTITNNKLLNENDFIARLSANARKQLRQKVLRNTPVFKVQVYQQYPGRQQVAAWYQLYLNVKNKSLELNTFALPLSFFEAITASPQWEVIELSLPGAAEKTHNPSAVIFCHQQGDHYRPMIIGMDYTHNAAKNIYRQSLFQVICRAIKLHKKQIHLGFGAGTEKQKMGAVALPVHAYVHCTDSFNTALLETLRTAVV